MNDYSQLKYYVYKHIDDKKVVYVGIGCGSRAFQTGRLSHRSKDHHLWLDKQYTDGNIPVKFIKTGLSRKEAHALEKALIEKFKPKFNKHHNPLYKRVSKVFSQEIILFMKNLREMGYSYTHIAYLLGAEGKEARKNTHAASIWRVLKNEAR